MQDQGQSRDGRSCILDAAGEDPALQRSINAPSQAEPAASLSLTEQLLRKHCKAKSSPAISTAGSAPLKEQVRDMIDEPKRDPNFFWTKTWGPPGAPQSAMLSFNSEGNRRNALVQKGLKPGDIVVYLTTDGVESELSARGLVNGAVEIEGAETTADESGENRGARDVDFKGPGRTNYRWPFGLTLRRSWRVISTMRNDDLIPGHGALGLLGAAQIHLMTDEAARRFKALNVEEVTAEGIAGQEEFRASLSRPWRQKIGERGGVMVSPGTWLYVAQIYDDHYGTTFKIGSGKPEERLAALNMYRRPSRGEPRWSMVKELRHEFRTVDAARDAEDFILLNEGVAAHRTPDHKEFLDGVSLQLLGKLFNQAVEVGRARDALEAAAAVDLSEAPMQSGFDLSSIE